MPRAAARSGPATVGRRSACQGERRPHRRDPLHRAVDRGVGFRPARGPHAPRVRHGAWARLRRIGRTRGPAPVAWPPSGRWGWRALWGGCLGLSLLGALHITQDIRAFRIIGSLRSLGDLERAVAVAPNNMEARALIAYLLVTAGRCDVAAPHIARAAALQPYSGFVIGLEKHCGVPRTAAARP